MYSNNNLRNENIDYLKLNYTGLKEDIDIPYIKSNESIKLNVKIDKNFKEGNMKVYYIEKDYVNEIKSTNYIDTYMVSILLSTLTIFIAVLKTLITISKIDPMICIRRTEEKIKIKENSFTTKLMTKIFKDYGNLASKNIQRNRIRTNLAIASMAIIFFLMMTV